MMSLLSTRYELSVSCTHFISEKVIKKQQRCNSAGYERYNYEKDMHKNESSIAGKMFADTMKIELILQ